MCRSVFLKLCYRNIRGVLWANHLYKTLKRNVWCKHNKDLILFLKTTMQFT